MSDRSATVVWFDTHARPGLEVVGGKCRNLAALTAFGLPVPAGFTVTTSAYREHLDRAGIADQIEADLRGGKSEVDDDHASQRITALIARSPIPQAISDDIADAYRELGARSGCGGAPPVAVRSSATAEDLAEASFAGLHATLLDVTGAANVVGAVQNCWASLFTPQAIAYRRQRGIGRTPSLAMAVGVQILVPAQSSGVMFTVDPVSGDDTRVVVEATYGLGETLVAGEVDPDRFVLDKRTGRTLETRIARKAIEMTCGASGGERRPIAPARQTLPCLADGDLARLLELARRVEAALGPAQDIEWAIDGDGRCFLLQARPVTTRPNATAPPEAPAALTPIYRDVYRDFMLGGAAEDGASHEIRPNKGGQP